MKSSLAPSSSSEQGTKGTAKNGTGIRPVPKSTDGSDGSWQALKNGFLVESSWADAQSNGWNAGARTHAPSHRRRRPLAVEEHNVIKKTVRPKTQTQEKVETPKITQQIEIKHVRHDRVAAVRTPHWRRASGSECLDTCGAHHYRP